MFFSDNPIAFHVNSKLAGGLLTFEEETSITVRCSSERPLDQSLPFQITRAHRLTDNARLPHQAELWTIEDAGLLLDNHRVAKVTLNGAALSQRLGERDKSKAERLYAALSDVPLKDNDRKLYASFLEITGKQQDSPTFGDLVLRVARDLLMKDNPRLYEAVLHASQLALEGPYERLYCALVKRSRIALRVEFSDSREARDVDNLLLDLNCRVSTTCEGELFDSLSTAVP
jgi:hypothetical protein